MRARLGPGVARRSARWGALPRPGSSRPQRAASPVARFLLLVSGMTETTRDRWQEAHVRLLPLLQDGLVAGLIGALGVALAHLVADVAAGAPLRTPTVLGQLVLGGLVSADMPPDVATAFWFTCIHIGLWVGLGTLGSWSISLVDAHPRLLALVFGGFACGFITLFYAAGAFQIPGLPPLHLWVGTAVGSAAAAAYLVYRHPKLAGHVAREHLTPTTIDELTRAEAHERGAVAAYEKIAARSSLPAWQDLLAEKRERVAMIREVLDSLDVPPTEAGETSWANAEGPALTDASL